MLVVRRKVGESIVIGIGEGIEIEILEAGPNRVKLGVIAPKHVSVFRKEVELTREANLLAANSRPDHILTAITDALGSQLACAADALTAKSD